MSGVIVLPVAPLNLKSKIPNPKGLNSVLPPIIVANWMHVHLRSFFVITLSLGRSGQGLYNL
jgi:hypothetical protein